jgi:dynein heavy chain
MNPGPGVRLPSPTQPPKYFGPKGTQPEDFPTGHIQAYLKQRKARGLMSDSSPQQAADPPPSPPPRRAEAGALPGVALPPVTSEVLKGLTPSVRIASYYSPKAFGVGMKEVATGVHPPPVAAKGTPRAEEAAHTEQYLVVPRLPLEHFDDPQFETHTPAEWVQLGQAEGGTPALSKYYESGEMVWAPCRVIGYNEEEAQYEVKWDATNKVKLVNRLNLRFEAEDRDRFEERIQVAEALRERQHAKCRLQRYVDEVEQEPVRPPSEECVAHILRCVAEQVPVDHLSKLEECVEEMHSEYKRAVKFSTTKYEMMDESEASRFKRMSLPLEPPPPPCPSIAQLSMPEPRMDFQACNNAIRSNLFAANEQVTKTIQQIGEAYDDVRGKLFVDVGLDEDGKYLGPVSIAAFTQRQKDHVVRLLEILHIDWRGEALHGVVNHLEDIFDFKQYSYEAYKGTHLYRFLRMVTLIMGQHLRELMERSIDRLVDFFEETVNSKSSPGPVFQVSLCLKNNRVVFEPTLEEVRDTVTSAMDQIFIDAAKIMKIDSEVFPIMELPADALATVSPQEAHLVAKKEKLLEMLDHAMEGPKALQASYTDFDELVQTDVATYRNQTPETCTTKEKCQEMAEKYQQLGAAAVVRSENEVTFSLLNVNCRALKQDIEEKALQLSNATLDQLVEILRGKNRHVHTEYQTIYDRVQEQPTNPEELTELKEYVASRETVFEELDDIVSEVNDTIGIFSECNYITPDDVLDHTCESNVWPSRITETVKDAQMQLEVEKQRFIEELRQNQSDFEKELDRTSEKAKNIAAEDSLEKVADVYEAVLDMEDKVVDLEKKAELYQSHETLLGFPPTEYPAINDIVNDFQPFAKLWRTAGMFNECYPQWMDGAFFEIDTLYSSVCSGRSG